MTENVIKLVACYKNLIRQDPLNYKLREEFGDLHFSLGLQQKAHKCYLEAQSLTRNPEIIKSLLIKKADCQKEDARLEHASLYEEKANSDNFYNYDDLDLEEIEQLLD